MSERNNISKGMIRNSLPPRIQKPPKIATEPIAVKLGMWGINRVEIAKRSIAKGIIYFDILIGFLIISV